MTRIPAVAHPLIASLRAQLSRLRRRRARRRRRPAGDRRGRRPGDAGDRGRVVICVLQFDAASVAVLDRLLAEGRLPNLAALRDDGRRHELETPGDRLRRGRLLHPLQRGRARRPRDLLPVPVVRAASSGPATPTAFEAPPAVWERLAARRSADARDRPLREPAPGERERRLHLRLGVLPTGSCCRAGRVPRVPRASTLRRHGRGPEATEIFGRPRPARAAAPAREADRGPGADRRPGRGAARTRALRPRLADVQRRAPRRPPVLGPLPGRRARRSTRRPARRSRAPSTRSTSPSTGRSAGCWRRCRPAPT